MSEPASPARVAVIQLDPQVGMNNRSSNLHQSLALATEAANGGANLIVLPELTIAGIFSAVARMLLITPNWFQTVPVCRHG